MTWLTKIQGLLKIEIMIISINIPDASDSEPGPIGICMDLLLEYDSSFSFIEGSAIDVVP